MCNPKYYTKPRVNKYHPLRIMSKKNIAESGEVSLTVTRNCRKLVFKLNIFDKQFIEIDFDDL